jgi:putative ABC transport system ATP-binding protein
MIRLENISKSFRSETVETKALQNVNMEVRKGEFIAITGPSGCGKTTLLNILGLLNTPDTGRYWLNGREVSTLRESDRLKLRRGVIGFVFQSFNLIDDMNVFENVELPLRYIGLSKSERKAKVNEVLERMNIIHRAAHYPQQLSGGQQQRVAVARAVVSNPQLILCDEPTGNLDSQNGLDVMHLLCDLNAAGTTIVMVTHSPHDASFAHRHVKLFDGTILDS